MTTASRIEMHDEIVSLYEQNRNSFYQQNYCDRDEMEEALNALVSLIDNLITKYVSHSLYTHSRPRKFLLKCS